MDIVHCTSMTSSTIVAVTKMEMTVKIGITLPKSTILKIDSKRGDIPRSRYIRRAVERYLGSNSKDIDSIGNKAAAASKKSRRK
jgi:metal-responsive CopG/Arc/MetJ family transcriptional regulator